jgi:hypothetical protein
MPSYRAYQVDASKRILSATWVEAANDEQAKAKAAAELCEEDIPTVELWQATRLVDEIACGNEDES